MVLHLNGVVVTTGEVGEVAGRADPQHSVTVAQYPTQGNQILVYSSKKYLLIKYSAVHRVRYRIYNEIPGR